MSVVRLRCAGCGCVVRVAPETVAVHPVVRCAQCNGLINVATSQVSDQDVKPARKPRLGRRRAAPSMANLGPIVGTVIGLTILLLVSIGGYFLVTRVFTPLTPHERILVKALDALEKMCQLMERAKTPQDFETGRAELETMCNECKAAVEEALRSPPPDKSFLDVVTKYTNRMQGLQKRYQAALTQLQANPELLQAFNAMAASLDRSVWDAPLRGRIQAMGGMARHGAGPDAFNPPGFGNNPGFPNNPGLGNPGFGIPGQRPPQFGDPGNRNPAPVAPPGAVNAPQEKDEFERPRPTPRGVGGGFRNRPDPGDMPGRPDLRGGGGGGPLPTLDEALAKLREPRNHDDGLRDLVLLPYEEARKKEVLDALDETADNRGRFDADNFFRVFKKWATKREDQERFGKHVEDLLKDFSSRTDILDYVGDNRIASAAPGVARQLANDSRLDRLAVGRALVAIGGAAAEKATLPYLNDLQPEVRQMAIEVLAQVGTQESVSALGKLQKDAHVGLAAKQAIRLILARKEKEKEKGK